MSKKFHITLKHDHLRAMKSYGELTRGIESNGEPWVKHKKKHYIVTIYMSMFEKKSCGHRFARKQKVL